MWFHFHVYRWKIKKDSTHFIRCDKWIWLKAQIRGMGEVTLRIEPLHYTMNHLIHNML
jgi:hypothetical protein